MTDVGPGDTVDGDQAEAAGSRAVTRRATWAVFAVFFLSGFGTASWASRLPTVRDQLHLNPAQMGLLVLFSAIGSICALPLAGIVVNRLGSRRAVLVFSGLMGAGTLVVALGVGEQSVNVVRVGLLVTGVGMGVWDASMNLQGAFVEQRLGRAIMPRFHAGFSFGTVAGAGLGALAAWAGLPVPWHLVIATALTFSGVCVGVTMFLPDSRSEPDGALPATSDTGFADPADSVAQATDLTSHPRSKRARSVWLEPRTLLIGLVVLGAALTEGAANDWVGLATVNGFGTTAAVGAIGLDVFLIGMTAMRLLGTGLLDRFGRVPVLRVSGAFALVGVLVFALVPSLPFALVGVALWGVGAALGFPVGMSAASDEPARAAARVSVVATIGYSAFFVGPPLIGFIANAVGYRHALLFVAIPVVLGLVVMNAVRPLKGAVGHD